MAENRPAFSDPLRKVERVATPKFWVLFQKNRLQGGIVSAMLPDEIRREEPVEFDPFAGPEIDCTIPTTEAQRRFLPRPKWGGGVMLVQREHYAGAQGNPGAAGVGAGEIRLLVDRHEALRSSPSANDLQMIVARGIEVETTFIDLSGLNEAGRDRELQAIADADMTTPFNLRTAPLFRARLIGSRRAALASADGPPCDLRRLEFRYSPRGTQRPVQRHPPRRSALPASRRSLQRVCLHGPEFSASRNTTRSSASGSTVLKGRCPGWISRRIVPGAAARTSVAIVSTLSCRPRWCADS